MGQLQLGAVMLMVFWQLLPAVTVMIVPTPAVILVMLQIFPPVLATVPSVLVTVPVLTVTESEYVAKLAEHVGVVETVMVG